LALMPVVGAAQYYPVRLNSILRKPIISDKNTALGFIVS